MLQKATPTSDSSTTSWPHRTTASRRAGWKKHLTIDTATSYNSTTPLYTRTGATSSTTSIFFPAQPSTATTTWSKSTCSSAPKRPNAHPPNHAAPEPPLPHSGKPTTTTSSNAWMPSPLPQLPLQSQPHEQWQSLQAATKEAISDHIPTTASFPKHPWISQATWQLIQQRSAARLAERFVRPNYTKTLESKPAKTKQRLAESEATLDPRQKWKWIKRVRSDYKPRPVSIRDSQGKPTSLSQQAQTFAEYLRDSHWAAPPTPYTGPTDPRHPAAAVDLSPITTAELNAALKELAHNKAAGPDSIPPEAWQWLDHHNQEALLRVLNQALLTATIPDDWHHAIVVEIYKGKGPLTDPASYRPISLLNTSYKLFAKIIHARLQAALDDRLREAQYGFRATRSTSQPIHIVRRLIERAEATGKTLYTIFLDWEKAFDKIHPDASSQRCHATASHHISQPSSAASTLHHNSQW